MRGLIIALSLMMCWNAGAAVLATVGQDKVTTDEFQRRITDIRKQTMNPPTNQQFLEDLIRFKMGVQEAKRMRLENDPIVKERMAQVLYNALLEKEIGKSVSGIKITEPEMRQFYKKNPELHLAHILIEMKPDATTKEKAIVRQRALQILKEVKSSKRSFGDLAHLYSDDTQTKDNGGDIGYQSRVTLVPEIYKTALKMKKGEVKGLIETRFGFHIIKLLDRRSYDQADKRQIRAALFDQKRAELFNRYFTALKKRYKIHINHEALKSLNR